MTRRYFVPELPTLGGELWLPDDEAAHAIRVMRVRPDDEITLFDGKGQETCATVLAIDRRKCLCSTERPEAVDRESIRQTHLAIALPKPDRAREMIERLTELGVRTVIPLLADRTQRPPSPSLLDKLGRAIVESSKQCGRNRLMELRPLIRSQTFFASNSASRAVRWIADPSAAGGRIPECPDDLIAAIGPEGGWTESELESATQAGFNPIGLGKRVLRIETSAALIAALMSS